MDFLLMSLHAAIMSEDKKDKKDNNYLILIPVNDMAIH